MTGGFLDRRRAQALMRARGLGALVLAQPETLKWATGVFPGVAAHWRRAGAAFLLIPYSADEAPIAIVGDLQAASFAQGSGISDVRAHRLWVETGRFDAAAMREGGLQAAVRSKSPGANIPRPANYDSAAALALLTAALTERGLSRARVGLELGFVPAVDFPAFQRAAPDVEWIDASDIVQRLRAIKHPQEIQWLRDAARMSMTGLNALLAELRAGLDAAAMTEIWRAGARAAAKDLGCAPAGADWAYIAVGGDGFAPGGVARAGDLIKIDVGCIVEGYSSDGARTAVIGVPSVAQGAVYDALRAGFEAGLELLRPGAAFREIYDAVARKIHAHGLEDYQRGHFGHGVGASIWSEEWPFISAESDVIAEPGMVLAFETPYYIEGLGGFILEDQFLITETGIEAMGDSRRELFVARSR